MSLLPSRLHVSSTPADPEVLDISGDEAADAFDALGSETARAVVSAVYDEPKTPSEIQDVVGTSLQNVHYHLDRLEDAGLVEPAGTGYSAKGNEMTVYGPAREAVVLFAGSEEDGSRLQDALARLFGMLLVVGVSTLVFAVALRRLTADGGSDGGVETMDAEGPTAAGDAAAGAADAAATVDPVVAFLLGGLAVVVAVGCWWALRPRLRSIRRSR